MAGSLLTSLTFFALPINTDDRYSGDSIERGVRRPKEIEPFGPQPLSFQAQASDNGAPGDCFTVSISFVRQTQRETLTTSLFIHPLTVPGRSLFWAV